MKKDIAKKILIYVGLGMVFYAVIWLALVGLTYLLFNVILGRPQNWWGSGTIFSLAAVLWAIGMGVYFYNEWAKRNKGKNKGLMSASEFKKIGTDYIRIDDPLATSKGWIIDSRKLVDGIGYKHYGNSNSIVYGITRAGKTTGFVLPTIYSNATAKEKPCFILTDKKDELYQKSSNFLTKQGYRIWKLDIADATNSNCWNPLTEIWKDYQQYKKADMMSEDKYRFHTKLTDRVNNLLDMLFREKSKDPIWSNSAKEFFAMILFANLDQDIAEKKFTLYELFKQFNSFSAKDWIENIAKIDRYGLVHEHKSIVADVSKAETTYAGIKAQALSELRFLSDATIQKISLDTDLPLNDFDKQPTALFLTLPAVSSDKVKLSSIYLQSFLKMCSELPDRENNENARPIYLLADEIGNIEPISGLSDLITTGLRKA